MRFSVEIEPPSGVYTSIEERDISIEEEITEYLHNVEMLSITNRPVFGLSAITMAKRVFRFANKYSDRMRVSLHLTTRLSHHDLFRNILDAHRMGLSDLLPILGDPRGPLDANYFENGYDILGFVSYLKSGNRKYLSPKYLRLLDSGLLVKAISGAKFNIGSVVDLNPVKVINGGETIDIREQQIAIAGKKARYGAEYLISQGIFDAQHYFDFIDQSELKIPIIPGLLPARSRLIETFGIPLSPLSKQTLRAQLTTKDEISIGNQMTKQVFLDLEEGGCKWVHIYSIGNPNNFKEIIGIEDLSQSQYRLNFEDPQKKGIKSP
ncbi:MAG: methylenetetrahydrofolate reductase [Candidatus Kariarchaeaceae archaeon]|jgi:5,10-methylenetetrahydrofolate reductase